VIRPGFNGARFLDFNKAVSSLLTALFTFAAIVRYGATLFLSSSAVGNQARAVRSSVARFTTATSCRSIAQT
jgi:hypothetical protein